MDEIQPADRSATGKVKWVFGIAALAGICAILVFESFQGDFVFWLEQNIDYLVQNTIVVFLVAVVFVSPVIAAGIYLFLLGRRIVQTKRFPPPDYVVYRDTRVLKGSLAIRRGRIVQLLSLLLLLAAGSIPFVIREIIIRVPGQVS